MAICLDKKNKHKEGGMAPTVLDTSRFHCCFYKVQLLLSLYVLAKKIDCLQCFKTANRNYTSCSCGRVMPCKGVYVSQ